MKAMICALGLVLVLAFIGIAHAETATWTGNTEPDVEAYEVYACDGAGCEVKKDPSMLKGTAPHVGAGVKHSFVIDLTGKEGNLAILARDTWKNRSGLTVSVPFDKLAPSVPVTPTLQ